MLFQRINLIITYIKYALGSTMETDNNSYHGNKQHNTSYVTLECIKSPYSFFNSLFSFYALLNVIIKCPYSPYSHQRINLCIFCIVLVLCCVRCIMHSSYLLKLIMAQNCSKILVNNDGQTEIQGYILHGSILSNLYLES